jgi:4-hydroxythreonine-4-phosphate dehydrogenase
MARGAEPDLGRTGPRDTAPPLALTRGDPSGIGPELALRAWLETHDDPQAPAFFVLAQPAFLSGLARSLGWTVPLAETEPEGATAAFARALPVLPLDGTVAGAPGTPDPADAAATIAAIERSVALVRAGRAGAVVTNPIAKEVLHRAGFAHPGHTEFLGELALRDFGQAAQPVMMLWSAELAVVPLTIHVPLAAVPKLITPDRIVATARIVVRELRERFGIARPRLVVAGLNPHSGEGGSMGREEIEIIAPAIAALAGECDVSGPYPADTLFHAAARARYDACIAMYHDQALIPIKTLAFDSAVNVTLGLPFVRTSPDHGTAFDIAGKGEARPESLLAALRLAARLARTTCPTR